MTRLPSFSQFLFKQHSPCCSWYYFLTDCSFVCVLTEGQLYFLVFSDKVSKLYIINNMILWCEKLNSTNKKNIVKDIKTWHFHLTRILWDITSEPRNNLLTNIFYWNLIENILIYIYIFPCLYYYLSHAYTQPMLSFPILVWSCAHPSSSTLQTIN